LKTSKYNYKDGGVQRIDTTQNAKTTQNLIVGYPTIHYSAILRYAWGVPEESTVAADDDGIYSCRSYSPVVKPELELDDELVAPVSVGEPPQVHVAVAVKVGRAKVRVLNLRGWGGKIGGW